MRGRARLAILLSIGAVAGAAAGIVSATAGVAGAPAGVAGAPGAAARAIEPLSSGEHTLVGHPCGAATSSTLAAADGLAAERIYASELVGPETVADRRQVEGYGPLLAALAAGNRAAVAEAVHALVYSHTHIVRLRVIRGGSVVDVGGPYVLAPVAGRLFDHGRQVGSYLLSVQDDLGVVGLVRRLIGVPLTLHVGRLRVPLQGTLDTGSVAIPDRGPVTIRGHSWEAFSFAARAFPTGVVRISLLLPRARSSARTCAAVRVAELGRIGLLIWRRFLLDGSPIAGFPGFLHSHTGALAYVRAGSRQIAGSTAPGPARLPAYGAFRYRRVSYGVVSFPARTAAGPVRVYQLVPL